ncbi:LytTR family DNA-binding domain-containing protein [Pedobacter panaciterrae]|jgi:Response regulator of the LytR/AlgR family|uniref:LytTR family DNA-binding domain-containing protein n=1 Tax=Pedobacter panaciterrae TaxID=363849 RepID=A0ABU8NMI0_9SPHI|nr:LytTR family DNA-binding domain-containing protein [Pedobacter panaciterrae]NQX53035.1 response regulator transcription factor [Pedobacter panaciterrae]
MKLYILEDEVRIMQHILQIVKKISYLEVVGVTDRVSIAAIEIPALAPDIILADIRLKDGDSFHLFDEIGMNDFQVVFLTAYDQYAIQALNLGAFGYLLKPIDEISLSAIFNKCFHHREQESFSQQQLAIAKAHYLAQGVGAARRVALKSIECIEIVAIDDIVFCKSDKGYTTFYLIDGREILVSKGLKEYESSLTPFGFLRCHQSYLVNFQFVKKYYREGYLLMENKAQILVSSRKKEEVLKYLENIA